MNPDHDLCEGLKSRLHPGPLALCVACERRLRKPQHPWQAYIIPPPAVHDGERWVCDRRIGQVDTLPT